MILATSQLLLALAYPPAMVDGVISVPGAPALSVAWLVPFVVAAVGILLDRDGRRRWRGRPVAPAARPRRLELRLVRGT